jgi:hypothetical protein
MKMLLSTVVLWLILNCAAAEDLRLEIQPAKNEILVMTFDWIAQRLRMGSWSYVSNLLGQNHQSICANSED